MPGAAPPSSQPALLQSLRDVESTIPSWLCRPGFAITGVKCSQLPVSSFQQLLWLVGRIKKKKRESICWWKCAAAAGMEPLDSGFSRRFREHLVVSKSVLGMGKGIGKGMGKGSCAQLRTPSPGVVPARGENALPVGRGCALLPALPREGTGRAQLEGGRTSGLSSRDDAALLDEGF